MSSQTWIGKKLGERYEIQELLGQGGMSAVYKALDENLGRVVAVKLIHPHLSSDPEFVRRFEEEAKAVAQLRHPNIIQVFDFDHDDDAYYIVFEFVPGETLQARLKRLHAAGRRMDISTALNIAGGIADALDYAHSRGLIHRDVKPANVMINVHNEPVLMDFGIVKIMGGTQHTATGAVMGTARYMSPEQIRGERIDERTDLYSLGIILFEMAGGRAPFEADSAMTVMMMHVNDPVPNLRDLRPDVPAALVSLINRALAKNRDSRFTRAAELASALRAIDPDTPAAAEATIIEPAVPAPESTSSTLPAPQKVSPASTPPGSRPTGDASDSGTGPTGLPLAVDRKRLAAMGAIGLLVLLVLACVVGVGVLFGGNLLGGDDGDGTPIASLADTPESTAPVEEAGSTVIPAGGVEETQEAPSATQSATVAPTTTIAPTETDVPPPTHTPEPTETPTPDFTPTPTVPAGSPYVRINDITLENERYVVTYETFEYTEALPGMHIHFFFDTVTPDQAGAPGSGPWVLYGGPRPFTGYTPYERPSGAEQMCALVANPDHSVHYDSGNCFPLPPTDS